MTVSGIREGRSFIGWIVLSEWPFFPKKRQTISEAALWLYINTFCITGSDCISKAS
jgi:hypothetical protein